MSAIAIRYARAFADVVSQEGSIAESRDAVHSFNQLVTGNQELQSVFSNPTIPLDQKSGVLEALLERMRPSKSVGNFLRLLLRNYRLHQLGDIVTAFDTEIDRRIGVITAEITTAAPVNDKERQALSNKLDNM